MSLINDALKRAKAAQQVAPPSPTKSLELRPAIPAAPAQRPFGIFLPAILLLTGALCLAVFWQMGSRDQSGFGLALQPEPEIVAHARTLPAAEPPIPVSPQSSQAQPILPAIPTTAEPASASTATPPVTEPAPMQGSEPPLAPESTLTTTPTVPQAVPLRLQGIVAHPTRPSALINNKILFIGDEIEGLTLKNLNAHSATLSGEGKSTVLKLAD